MEHAADEDVVINLRSTGHSTAPIFHYRVSASTSGASQIAIQHESRLTYSSRNQPILETLFRIYQRDTITLEIRNNMTLRTSFVFGSRALKF